MQHAPYILAFDDILPEHAPIVGNKAMHLAQMAQAGLPVPPGCVLTTRAYHMFLHANGISPDQPLHAEMLEPLPIPEPIVSALMESGRRFPAVSVRSSASTEDLPKASFAGQYETFLNVTTPEDLLDRVRACWASLWTERARAYRQQHHGQDEPPPAMAVIIQHQVPAQVSGVLFTLNPLTGREEETVIEATWGLGEALVSGKVSPDRYVVNTWHGELIQRDVADKQLMTVTAETGTQTVPVPPEKRRQPCLTEPQWSELVRLGRQVQELFGQPQDVEWAIHEGKVYLLQARPLTSFTFAPDFGQWTSANLGEVMPGVVNPLSFSLCFTHSWNRTMDDLFTRLKMMRPEERGQIEWTRMLFGRAYWNVGATKRFTALIPGFRERAFDETLGISPTYEGDGQVTPWTPRTVLRAIPILFALNHLYDTVWREAETYVRRFLDEEPALRAVDPSRLDDEALADHVRAMIELHYRSHSLALLVSSLSTQAHDDFRPMVEKLNQELQAAGVPERISEARLMTGLTNMRTARPLLALWRLARQALADPEVAHVIRTCEPSQLPERLHRSEAGRHFWQKIEAFLQEYGYMAPNDEDLTQPRWSEDPTFVLETLKGFVVGDGGPDPEAQLARQQAVRQAEERLAARWLTRGWLHRLFPFRRRRFMQQLELVRRYCWWREETRDILSRTYALCRRALVEQGRRWAAQGFLAQPDDIFWLERDHVLAALDGRLSAEAAADIVRRYRSIAASFRHFDPPTTVGMGPAEVVHVAPPTGETLRGVACSPGRVTAPARVIMDLTEAHRLRKGEILIAPYTNPGWTPLFSIAGGIVMEEGGLLSHGAVVAREVGVPAVIRVPGVTRLVRDGQIVTVDGTHGLVELGVGGDVG